MNDNNPSMDQKTALPFQEFSFHQIEKRKGKDNLAWTLTRSKHVVGVVFHPRKADKIKTELTMDRVWKGIPEEGTASANTHV